ncbi:MAG: DUF2442 domain-containing protein [Gammaproteobacteria bacterium]|nr:DUF2442 domain-containing protein [Gammaproteobacteria bacterium]MDD9875527.1 DUF2442 domain-containing protein [Gammaproteobacteria bacterium]
MNSLAHGGGTLPAEAANISGHGIWLLAGGRELFPPHQRFPWFKDQTVAAITHVEEPSPGHFYRPDIDVDLSAEIIAHPERFPLMAKCA